MRRAILAAALIVFALMSPVGASAQLLTTGSGPSGVSGGGGGFTLASIQSKLKFWYDVADASTVTSGGNIIVSMNNLGTQGSSTLTSTGAQAGSYEPTGVGGNPAIVFAGSWPWMQSAGTVNVAAATDRTIWVVAKMTSNSNNQVLFAVGNNPAFNSQGFGLVLWNNVNGCCIGSSGDLFMFGAGSANVTPQFAAASAVASDFTNPHLFEANLGTGSVDGFIDGVNLGSGRAGSGTGTVPTVTDSIWVGVNPGIENDTYKGAIWLVCDGCTPTDRANVRTLLKTRFGIP